MQSKRIESVLAISKQYGCLPSEVLGIDDAYTAFCFNEACMSILYRLMNDEKPFYIEQDSNKDKPKNYKNFEDFYKNIYGGER